MWADTGSASRISAMFWRYVYLYRRSMVRMFDIVFWPVMELLLWGFVTRYIQQTAEGPLAQTIVFLIGAMIAWDIHYRGQLAMTVSVMEEIWTRNLVNILIAPLRIWEWVVAGFLHSVLKITLITLILALLANGLYAFNVLRVSWAFIPLAANLLVFGWAIGFFTAGLLVRFGYAAEALIWGIPFLVQPFSCVFYPISALPFWAQIIARCLPSTYVFEGLRVALWNGRVAWTTWAVILGLNVLYVALGLVFFIGMLRRARSAGQFGRIGQE